MQIDKYYHLIYQAESSKDEAKEARRDWIVESVESHAKEVNEKSLKILMTVHKAEAW